MKLPRLPRNPDWTEQELVLALESYFRIKAGASKREETKILSVLLNQLTIHALSKRQLSFRDPDGVRVRIDYFKRHDQGAKALTQIEYLNVWRKYASNPNGLAAAAARIIETNLPQEILNGGRAPFIEANDDNPEHIQFVARKIRAGQPQFRENLLRLYNNQCAITASTPTAVLEAAHIVFHAKSGLNKVCNGILLRADLHILFDDNLLRIHPKTLKVVLDKCLKGTDYWLLNGAALRARVDGTHPSTDCLHRRWEKTPITKVD